MQLVSLNENATMQDIPHRRQSQKNENQSQTVLISIAQKINKAIERDDGEPTVLGFALFVFLGFTFITQGAYIICLLQIIGLV